MPNQPAWDILVSHWLEVKSADVKVFDPNSNPKHVFYVWPCNNNRDNYIVVRCKDPNDSLQVTSWHKNRFGMDDLNIYLKTCMAADPNYPRVKEPNKPADPCEPNLVKVLAGVDDPNLVNFIKSIWR